MTSLSMKCILKLTPLNMPTKTNMIMLITSSYETPYPSPYMGYIGMWVDLRDGPKKVGINQEEAGRGGEAGPGTAQ